jgi:CBS domain-containing protein
MQTMDVMTRNVISVRPNTPLKDVARLLAEHGIGGVPVVDAAGDVIGIVSESDFILKERGREHVRRSRLSQLLGEASPDAAAIAARTAGQLMTTPAVTIDQTASVREAAIVMSDRKINRLPVTDSGRLVGIITRGDVVGLYAQSDKTLEDRVREALHAVDGLAIESVMNGVVTLGGTVASASLIENVVDVAAGVEGIVAVDTDHVTICEPEALPEIPVG